jgi:hypothetical protein
MKYQTITYKSEQPAAIENPVQREPEKTISLQPPARFVEILRARGIKVRVQHYRWVDTFEGAELHRISKYNRKIDIKNLIPLDPIFQNGGETHVSIQLQDGREAKGVAVCNTTDLYNKRLGVWIAAKRALAVLKDEKPVLTVYPPS